MRQASDNARCAKCGHEWGREAEGAEEAEEVEMWNGVSNRLLIPPDWTGAKQASELRRPQRHESAESPLRHQDATTELEAQNRGAEPSGTRSEHEQRIVGQCHQEVTAGRRHGVPD